MAGKTITRAFLLVTTAVALMACQDGGSPFAKAEKPDTAASAPVAGARSVKLVDRDVEAPEVFQVTDDALWDGRPSLGGVWVASPEAMDPERVILRNPANGKFVIGALFRRERDNPGPTLQISSDAAAALGLLAGQPGKVSVTALRREEAPQTAPDATKPILDQAETVETETLDPVAGAGAAIAKAESEGKGKKAKPAAPAAPLVTAPAKGAAPAPQTAAPASPGAAGLIQIGIFSVEENAKRAVDTLTKAGVAVTMRAEKAQGKPFWSVTAKGDAQALAKVKSAGFTDAYFLKRG
jgi:hypothetical protein